MNLRNSLFHYCNATITYRVIALAKMFPRKMLVMHCYKHYTMGAISLLHQCNHAGDLYKQSVDLDEHWGKLNIYILRIPGSLGVFIYY